MRFHPGTRLVFLGVVNGLILLHIVAYYVFDRTDIGCVDFFGLATFAGKGQITAGTVFLGALILVTLVLGRVFCGRPPTINSEGTSQGEVASEVYLLSGGLSGDVTKDDIVPHTRMTRSVPRGTNRFVRLNVTQAVREILKAPASNYGLVVGSLTGGRDSLFALKRGTFTGNADARLVFSTSD